MIIIHEYGEPSHYQGAISENKKFDNNVKFYEFSTLRLIFKSLRRKKYTLVWKAIKDFFFLVFVFLFPLMLKDKYVIIGIAPLDYRILFFNRILKYACVTYHSSWLVWDGSKFPKENKRINRYLVNKWLFFLKNIVNSFAVVTETVKEQLVKYMNVDASKIEVVYHSFDETIFYKDKKKSSARNFNALYVGRLIKNKGIEDILEIAKKNKDINFYFIGNGAEDYKIKNEEAKCKNVFYIGYISDKKILAQYYNQGDFILLPSKRSKDWEELFGMVIIEAMACGCIPVCTDHNGPKIILNRKEWRKNIIEENDYIVETNKLLRHYISDVELINADKQLAQDTAIMYGKTSISSLWSSVFFKAGRKK